MTGEWPMFQVDHKDNDRLNNRWENLRKADNQTNQANAKKSKNNTSGYKGVFWNSQRQKYHGKIQVNGKQIHLGSFVDPKKAHEAYIEAAKKYYGEFANGG
jgi:hypothetical protein